VKRIYKSCDSHKVEILGSTPNLRNQCRVFSGVRSPLIRECRSVRCRYTVPVKMHHLSKIDLESRNWVQQGDSAIFLKNEYVLTLYPNYKILIRKIDSRINDSVLFRGKCENVETLDYISNLLEIE